MSLFHKRREKVPITLAIGSMGYSANPNAQFQVEVVVSKKNSVRTTQIFPNSSLTNDISQQFSASVEFELVDSKKKKKKKQIWKKKYIKFHVYVVNKDRQVRVAKFEEDISGLCKTNSLSLSLATKKTAYFGRIDLKVVISKTTINAPLSSTQSKNRTSSTISNTNNNTNDYNNFHDNNNNNDNNANNANNNDVINNEISTVQNSTIERSHSTYKSLSSTLQQKPKLTFENLIIQDCQFFLTNEPEYIIHSPQFTMNIISHCSTNITQINIDFLLNQLTEAFGAIHNSSISTDVYLLVSVFHLISTFTKRRWTPTSLIEIFTEFLMSVMQDLMTQMKARFREQIIEDPNSPEVAYDVCLWLTSIGSGALCQKVFTGILFLFAASFGKNICFALCSAFSVREKAFTNIFQFVLDEPDLETGMFEMTIHAILQMCVS